MSELRSISRIGKPLEMAADLMQWETISLSEH